MALESSPEDCVEIPAEYVDTENSPDMEIGQESKPNNFSNFNLFDKRSEENSDGLECKDKSLDEMDLIGDGFFESMTIAANPEPVVINVKKNDNQSPYLAHMTYQSMVTREETSNRVKKNNVASHLQG